MLKTGFMASGRGSNFQAIVDAIERGDVPASPELLIVDAGGAYAIERAKRHGIAWLHLDPGAFPSRAAYYERVAGEFKARGVELVVLAGFMRVVGRPLLDAFPMKIINIHPALLPSFPGLHGQRQALAYGVRFAGCTVHFVDAGVDTGPIVIQAVVPVLPGDTVELLSERILGLEHRVYPEAVRLIAEGRVSVEGRRVTISGGAPVEAGSFLVNPQLS
jgi:phosphoribosylglycinamide formyltransferase-1